MIFTFYWRLQWHLGSTIVCWFCHVSEVCFSIASSIHWQCGRLLSKGHPSCATASASCTCRLKVVASSLVKNPRSLPLKKTGQYIHILRCEKSSCSPFGSFTFGSGLAVDHFKRYTTVLPSELFPRFCSSELSPISTFNLLLKYSKTCLALDCCFLVVNWQCRLRFTRRHPQYHHSQMLEDVVASVASLLGQRCFCNDQKRLRKLEGVDVAMKRCRTKRSTCRFVPQKRVLRNDPYIEQ